MSILMSIVFLLEIYLMHCKTNTANYCQQLINKSPNWTLIILIVIFNKEQPIRINRSPGGIFLSLLFGKNTSIRIKDFQRHSVWYHIWLRQASNPHIGQAENLRMVGIKLLEKGLKQLNIIKIMGHNKSKYNMSESNHKYFAIAIKIKKLNLPISSLVHVN